MIQFKNVSKIYHLGANDYPVLRNINLTIEKGEYVLITGKSGSGKSTLLNILTGVDRSTSGEVIINKTDILKYNEMQMTIWRGENIGIVFQFFQLIPTLSVLENILLPMDLLGKIPRQDRENRARRLLGMVEMSEHEAKIPFELSGGEQQRVAIARALANDAGIIIADEPTGNLDSKNVQIVFDIFARLKESGKTIIMVTHEKEILKGASRKVILVDGEIVDDYPVGEVSAA